MTGSSVADGAVMLGLISSARSTERQSRETWRDLDLTRGTERLCTPKRTKSGSGSLRWQRLSKVWLQEVAKGIRRKEQSVKSI
jgi:hypothetical protein